MSLITQTELESMKKATYSTPINPACRVVQLIPLSEKESLKGTPTPANRALKTLTDFCKRWTKKTNIVNIGPDIARDIEVLRSAGLGKYFYQPDAEKAKANINKAAAAAAEAQKAAEALPTPEQPVTNAVNKVVNAVNLTKNAKNAVNLTKNAVKAVNATKNAVKAVNVTKNVVNATKNITLKNINSKLNRVLSLLEKPTVGGRRKTYKRKH